MIDMKANEDAQTKRWKRRKILWSPESLDPKLVGGVENATTTTSGIEQPGARLIRPFVCPLQSSIVKPPFH